LAATNELLSKVPTGDLDLLLLRLPKRNSLVRESVWRINCFSNTVRSLILGLFFASVLTLAASLQPLSNKEIALMLRSGCSSASVLADLQRRRALERLDEATRKSLLEFGASTELVSALESGAYLVSASEADAAQDHAAKLAAQRSAAVEQDRKFNTLLQAQQAEARARSAAAPPTNETRILDALKTKLVHCNEGAIKEGDGGELKDKKLIALYYSAHWCGPCRKFTPQLVEYYNRVVRQHPEFEIIFVSDDRSRYNWQNYIQEEKMPWLAIDYDQLAALPSVQKLGGKSIPSLLVLSDDSRLLASSYNGAEYLGPQSVLATLDQIFASGAAAH
jgi:nucleoredoxin